MKPFCKVVKATVREGTSLGLGTGMCRWWDLTLDCGHEVERTIRFPKQVGNSRRGFAAIYHKRALSEKLPPPKRCRCDFCPDMETP